MADIEVAGASGSCVKASLSDRIVVRLPENGATGYEWVVTEVGAALDVASSELVLPDELAPGAAGQRIVTVRPRGTGRARLVMQLRRAWESEPIEQFELEVDVTG